MVAFPSLPRVNPWTAPIGAAVAGSGVAALFALLPAARLEDWVWASGIPALIDVLAYPRKRMRLTELVTPLKPLEAMAQGRLVAASDVGGHRELIRDGETGTLFRPDDPAAIAQALAALLADRSGWDARRTQARAFVERERNWSSNIAVYQPVYQGLLAACTDGSWSRSPHYRV